MERSVIQIMVEKSVVERVLSLFSEEAQCQICKDIGLPINFHQRDMTSKSHAQMVVLVAVQEDKFYHLVNRLKGLLSFTATDLDQVKLPVVDGLLELVGAEPAPEHPSQGLQVGSDEPLPANPPEPKDPLIVDGSEILTGC